MPPSLPSGKVLVAGGNGNGLSDQLASSELYDVGLGFATGWQPRIVWATSPLHLGASLTITGDCFRGVSGASSGAVQDSTSGYPVVALWRLDNGHSIYLPATNWSNTSFTSGCVIRFALGPATVIVFVNGIPSVGSVLNVRGPAPAASFLTAAAMVNTGLFQFSFTNHPGAQFTVLASALNQMPWWKAGLTFGIRSGRVFQIAFTVSVG